MKAKLKGKAFVQTTDDRETRGSTPTLRFDKGDLRGCCDDSLHEGEKTKKEGGLGLLKLNGREKKTNCEAHHVGKKKKGTIGKGRSTKTRALSVTGTKGSSVTEERILVPLARQEASSNQGKVGRERK